MKRKQILPFITALVLCVGLLAGCTGGNTGSSQATAPQLSSPAAEPSAPGGEPESALEPEETPDVVRVFGLKGPTTMGLVKLWQDSEETRSENRYVFEAGTTDEVIPKIAKGEVDIAAVPANLAAVLYQNTDKSVQVVAINTLGVLYIVERGETIHSVEDLRGRTLYATGKGATPEMALNYVLAANGLDPAADLTVEFKSEPAEIIPLLAQDANAVALIQQPFATSALEKVENLRVALDWTEQWDKVAVDGSTLITGVMLARREFAEAYPHAVEVFLREYAVSVDFTNSHVPEAAQLVEHYGIIAADIAEKAIPACNIVCIPGAEMRQKLSGYLQVLCDQEPASVGGAMPEDDFYFIR